MRTSCGRKPAIDCVPALPGTKLPRVVERVRNPAEVIPPTAPEPTAAGSWGWGGRPWSRGCGGVRGPGAVAAVASVLTSESRAGMGTELRIRVENEEGSYWARSPSHFPPLPIWAGKERKPLTSPGLLSPWFGGGEERAAGPF